MSSSLRFAAVAAAAGMALGTSGALADGYYVGSVKDAPPAPVAYEWNGLSVGAGIGVGRFDQDAYGEAWREDNVKRKECTEQVPVWVPVWIPTWPHGGYWSGYWNQQCTKHDWVSKPELKKSSELESASKEDDWNFFGTVQVGYDRLLGDRFLIGAFADFDFYRNADLTFSDVDDKSWLSGKVERDHMWAIGARLGYLVSPRILVYGLAAYSQMKLDGSLTAHLHDPWGQHDHSELGLKIKDRVDGWTVGGGVEAKLERRLSLKLEYRYSQFDGASASTASDHPYGEQFKKDNHWYKRMYSDSAKLDLGDTDVHSVRAVLSFKLGRDEEPIAPLK